MTSPPSRTPAPLADTAAFEPGDTTANIDLAGADDTVSCTFTNTERGTIDITKEALGDDGTFTFTDTVEAPNTFDLDTTGTPVQSFTEVLTDTYTVTETVPTTGWDLTGIVCTDNGGTSGFTYGANSVEIDLAPGDDVDCTFTNTKRGTIDITKTTVGGTGEFDFTHDTIVADPGGFDRLHARYDGGPDTQQFLEVAPGTFTVTETEPQGWDLTGIECTSALTTSTFSYLGGADDVDDTVFEAGDNSVEITLGAGDAAACDFTNTERGTIEIVKDTVGGDGTFGFTDDTVDTPLGDFTIETEQGTETEVFENVVPGTYAITESAEAGWDLTGLSCVDPDDDSSVNLGTATIDVDPGETVTCTFTNTKRGTINIVQDANPNDATGVRLHRQHPRVRRLLLARR